MPLDDLNEEPEVPPVAAPQVKRIVNPYAHLLPHVIWGFDWVLVNEGSGLYFVDFGANDQNWSPVFTRCHRWADNRLAQEFLWFLRKNKGNTDNAKAAIIKKVPELPVEPMRVPITEVEDPFAVKSFHYQGLTMPEKPIELKIQPRPSRPVYAKTPPYYSGENDIHRYER